MDDNNSWRGPFYYNPKDTRWLVPKKFGIGFTFNFAHTFTKVFIVVMVIIPLLLYYFTTRHAS